jgi:hypothetical protein
MTRPALLLLAALPVLAQQTGALTGHLIDSATKAPIPNATIKLPNTETTSNPQGQFHFPALPPGAHRATISHPSLAIPVQAEQDSGVKANSIPG